MMKFDTAYSLKIAFKLAKIALFQKQIKYLCLFIFSVRKSRYISADKAKCLCIFC